MAFTTYVRLSSNMCRQYGPHTAHNIDSIEAVRRAVRSVMNDRGADLTAMDKQHSGHSNHYVAATWLEYDGGTPNSFQMY